MFAEQACVVLSVRMLRHLRMPDLHERPSSKRERGGAGSSGECHGSDGAESFSTMLSVVWNRKRMVQREPAAKQQQFF